MASSFERKIVAPSTSPNHKDWSRLPRDIVGCFLCQIDNFKDLGAFRGVCKSWRSKTIDAKSNIITLKLNNKVPILLYSKGNKAPSRDVYSLTQGQFYQLDLSETKNKSCHSSLGWLLLVSGLNDLDNLRRKLELFNPLAHAHIELPSISRKMFDLVHLERFLLSSSPTRVLDYGVVLLSRNRLVFYKPRYNNDLWTRVRTPSLRLKPRLILMDVVFHKGEIYVIDFYGRVLSWDTKDPYKAHMKLLVSDIRSPLLSYLPRRYHTTFLVEFAGALVLFFALSTNGDVVTSYWLLEVPIYPGELWKNSPFVKTLGNKTLFVSDRNSSFWIEPSSDSVCQPNCIYFVNQRGTEESSHMDVGIYHMEDGEIERPHKQLRCSMLQLDLWLQPNF